MRDVLLTMSNAQSLAVPVDDNLSATDSTVEVPEPSAGNPEPSGETPLAEGLDWILLIEEKTGTPIQVEGNLHAELQYSLDGGSSWQTGDGVEIQLDDPALAASAQVRRRTKVGWAFRDDLDVTDPTQVRYKTVYSTTGRVMGDGAATVEVTSYLSRGAAE